MEKRLYRRYECKPFFIGVSNDQIQQYKNAARTYNGRHSDIYKQKLKLEKLKPTDIKIIRRSVDARHKDDIHFVYTVAFQYDNENGILKKNTGNKNVSLYKETPYSLPRKAQLSNRPVIIGFGPAGMFAALYLAQCGVRPIVLERGLDVDSRKEKVRLFWEKAYSIQNATCSSARAVLVLFRTASSTQA